MDCCEVNKAYFGKRDNFYCIVVNDIQTLRDYNISEILGEKSEIFYLGSKLTNDISMARFWKDKDSVKRFIFYNVATEIKGANISSNKKEKYLIKELNREEFLKIIPDEYEIKDYITIRNSKIKAEEKKYDKRWKILRRKYKATESYTKVNDPINWLPCKDCGLIPLVWEFDNGRRTACGCGKDDYNHHYIGAESIMSYIVRNSGSSLGFNNDELRINWNHWVKTGQDLFKKERKKNNKIW
jgi:hypothetical protein